MTEKDNRPFTWTIDLLRHANLRPTCQRMGLVKLIYGAGNRHLCAEDLFKEARASGLNLSLATVYNALNQFKSAGILQEILTGGGKTYYDTTMAPHAHIFYEGRETVEDVMPQDLTVSCSPALLEKMNKGVMEIVIRVP